MADVEKRNLWNFGFFLFNADLEIFNEAMDYAGFPGGEGYRLEKFKKMQRSAMWFLGEIDNRYLSRLEDWLNENINYDIGSWNKEMLEKVHS